MTKNPHKITPSHLQLNVKQAVKEWLSAGEGRSQNSLAKASGNRFSNSTISQLLNDIVHISDSKLMSIARAVGFSLQEELHWEVAGDNFSKIGAIVRDAVQHTKPYWIEGASSTGKSYSLTKLVEENEGVDGAMQLSYIELQNGMSNAQICLELLAPFYTKRKMKDLPKQAGKLRAILAEKLLEHRDGLIIDQMEFGMSLGKLKFLHGLWDMVKQGVAVIFSGANTLQVLVKKRAKPFYNQLFTRFEEGFRVIGAIDGNYVRNVCYLQGVTDESAVNWFIYNCRHFRTLNTRMKKAMDFVGNSSKLKDTSELTAKHLNNINKAALESATKLEIYE